MNGTIDSREIYVGNRKLKQAEFDEDGDGKFETVQYYNEQGKLIRVAADSNHNGKMDRWSYFSGNQIDHTAFDTNGNGKADQWQYYDGGKAIKKVEYDTNGDGKADRWEHFTDGKLAKVELDRNFDGKIDLTQNK